LAEFFPLARQATRRLPSWLHCTRTAAVSQETSVLGNAGRKHIKQVVAHARSSR
jgi:hypothetical protein